MRFFILLFLSVCLSAKAGSDSSSFKPGRFYGLIGGVGVAYTGSMIGLSQLWYKNEPKSSFHFFNDNHEWLQIDKFGHAITAFHESKFGVDMLQWTGLSRKKSIIYGSLAGFIFQSPIEIFDGYSAAYGASSGDLIANASGSALVLGQYLLWDELRIHMKFSYRPSPYAALRPDVLGANHIQRGLKDYNGQTYWLSCNLKSMFFRERKFPSWLNVAIGYGGERMVYGEPEDNRANGYKAYRQFYLSFDIDPQKIKTKSKFVKGVFWSLNIFKVPFPTLGVYGNGRVAFLPFY